MDFWARSREWVSHSAFRVFFLFLLLAVLPIILFSYSVGKTLRERSQEEAFREGKQLDTLGATLVREHFSASISFLQAYSYRFMFRKQWAKRNMKALIPHLKQAYSLRPDFVFFAIFEVNGTLRAIYPPDPGVLGRNFAYRDWYRGVSRDWKPYVSSVYQTAVTPSPLVVGVAVPIKDDQGKPIGILMGAYSLKTLSAWLQRIQRRGTWSMKMVDQHGQLAASPDINLFQSPVNLSEFEPVQRVTKGEKGSGIFWMRGEEGVISYEPIADLGWGVLAEQPVAVMRAEIDAVDRETWLLCLVFVGLALGGGTFTASLYRETVKARNDLESLNEHLEEKVEERAGTLRQEIEKSQRLEQQLTQSQKMEAVGRLAGGVAHDFNNLLTVITGYSQLLLERFGPENPAREHVAEIQKAGKRAASLTRQLLAFSRQQVLRPQVLDLNSVVGSIEKMLRRLIGEDIELVTVLQPNLGRVKADPGQIDQVIINLAVNARDAMPQGGKLTIETADVELDENYSSEHATVKPGSYVMLAASDTGIGMDAEIQKRIFEPFFTTKEQGKGTGLGLATVYGIIKQSGGHIWVYSEPGHGATFKIYLPRAEKDVAPREETPVTGEQLQGTETILLVEDEEAVRSLARHILESSGYRVLEASSGPEALRVSEQHQGPIHLLLTDVVMPKMSGRELAQQIMDSRPDAKIVYMSGYTDDVVFREGMLEPGTEFLQKPFSSRALRQKARAALSRNERPPAAPA